MHHRDRALPWSLHADGSYVQRTEAPERDADSELQQAELDDAERDRVIAMKPAQMPADLCDKAKVYAALAEPIVVLDPGRQPLTTPKVSFTFNARVTADSGDFERPMNAPDLLFEELSPDDAAADIKRKREVYFAGGSLRVVELDQRKRTMVVWNVGRNVPLVR